jgi:hypothetical protein
MYRDVATFQKLWCCNQRQTLLNTSTPEINSLSRNRFKYSLLFSPFFIVFSLPRN